MTRLVALWEGWVAYLLLPGLALLVTADVGLRYLFGAPLTWAGDVKELALLGVVTAGLPGASLDGAHIRVTLVDERLPASAARVLAAFRHAVGLAVATVLAWALADLARDMARFGERAEFVPLPYWPVAALIALAAGLSAVAEAMRLARALKGGEGWSR